MQGVYTSLLDRAVSNLLRYASNICHQNEQVKRNMERLQEADFDFLLVEVRFDFANAVGLVVEDAGG